ncbi:hypothetical protein F4782DRAFT_524618 [Xylaria castorea]|nr:hypothetical protein F4782DRAFT_524618 [Xylaria castorea]
MNFLLCLAAASLATAEKYFSISTFNPGTRINGLHLHAADKGFHTGLSGPSTRCPLTKPSDCPPVLGTLVAGKMGGMAARVPGGQGIYVQANGQVKFEMAHSHVFPPGAVSGCWQHETIDHFGNEVINFNDGNGHSGLVLCYNDDSKSNATLYAKTEGSKVGSCTDIVGLTLTDGGSTIGCWQYE